MNFFNLIFNLLLIFTFGIGGFVLLNLGYKNTNNDSYGRRGNIILGIWYLILAFAVANWGKF